MAIGLMWRSVGRGLALCMALPALQGCALNKSALASASPLERQFAAAATTWDLNHDGDVTCEEWKQYATGLFRAADADHDGALTPEEFAALARQDRLFEMAGFAYFDADGDGRITLAEIIDKPNPAFALLDTNHDCVITPEERRSPDAKPSGKGKRGA
jgi:Ca2+-binding EF-hand superfamily protein